MTYFNSEYQYIKNGYILKDFPSKIKTQILNFILSKFEQPTVNDLEKFLLNLTDEVFSSLFSKGNRIIGDEKIENLLNDYIKNIFVNGSFINQISKAKMLEGKNLNANSLDIQFRCARFKKNDVAPAHRDSQFWNGLKGSDFAPKTQKIYNTRSKVWIPIYGCTKGNSLNFIPGSHNHKIDLNYDNESNTPSINKDYIKQNTKNFICPFNNFNDKCVIFHDDVIHKGVQNNDTPIRISAEFTVCS